MSNQQVINQVYGLINPLQPEFEQICSEPSISFKRESEFAMQIFANNDYLAGVAINSPVTTCSAIKNVAAIGITLNPAQKLAYLVPRKGRICLDISYMGLMHIAQQSGAIKWCQSSIVRINDKFMRTAIDRPPVHEFNEFGTTEERGEIVGAYCVVKTDDGDYLTHTMRIADIFAKVLFGRFDNIICSQTGTQLTTTTMARGFAKARELSGIQWEKEPPSFHELRSLSARLYTEEKGTEFAQRLLGHKSAVMTAKYQDNRGSEWVKVAT